MSRSVAVWNGTGWARVVAAVLCLALLGLAPTANAEEPPEKGAAPAAADEGPPPAEDPAQGAAGERDLRQEEPSSEDFDELAAVARRDGQVRAVVGLPVHFVPEGNATAAQRRDQRSEIARQQAAVRKDLAGTQHRIPHEFDTVPFMAVEVTEEGLARLRGSDNVARVEVDVAVPPAIDSSAPVVQSDLMAGAGFTGTGQMVAILDTGVDRTHAFFGGRVVEEACYSTTSAANGSTTLCPNGTGSQTGDGAAAPCTGIDGCEHGTPVAGIAAGSASPRHGVARNAPIMGVQVFSRFDGANCGIGPSPCVLTYTTDQMAGLERVYTLRNTHSIAAANMSLGGGVFTSACDSDARKTVIDNLASANIATVIAAGNNGWSHAVGAPGCISSAITVGSTTDGDTVSSFSNSHETMIDVYAPGSNIVSSVPGGGYAEFSGTSMAAPQVAGAWSALRHHRPSATVATLRNDLRTTGRTVTDDRDAGFVHSHPRIRVHSAAFGLPANSNMFASATPVTATPQTHFQPTDGATTETGEPTPCGSIAATVWYSYTPSTDGTATVDTVGSNFDTVLAAYTGSAVDALTDVACNNDTTGLQSAVSFPVVAGQTYRLQLGGYLGDAGDARLNVAGPPPISGTVAGTVTDAATGDPIADATVSAGAASTVTAADGTYTLADLAPATHTLSVTAASYQPATTNDVVVNAGQTTTADVELQPDAAVPGASACPTGLAEATFGDRDAISEAHRSNVDCAASNAIVQGFPDGTYGPTLPVRRDQMASFIARTLTAGGVTLPEPSGQRFTDVSAGSAHDDAIHRLAAAGIVLGGAGGLSTDSYGPGLQVRRDQMASFLIRAAEFAHSEALASETAAFDDVPASNPHFANVNGAAEIGLAAGFGDGTFRPGSGVRRDQMATFVTRLLTTVSDSTA